MTSSPASSQDATEKPPNTYDHDLESNSPAAPKRIPHFQLIFNQGVLTPEMINHTYAGHGTTESPYLVSWLPGHDPRNPMNFSEIQKWSYTMLMAVATLAVALTSSAYSGGVEEIIAKFQISSIVATLGISVFVVGFAVGPLLWAPLSEMFGRQVLFFGTYLALTAFNAGAAGANSVTTLMVMRLLAGCFGSSPLTNAGGVIADMFSADERGLAMAFFAAAPFMGPALGPIIGGAIGINSGWRWVEGFLAIFSGALWILVTLTVPETYSPVLLRKRAEALSKKTGKVYVSKLEAERGKVTLGQAFKTALSRPWILLFKEPIVLLLSIYMAIIYGTLYMLFAAFPIVYEQQRGWNAVVGALPFLGVLVGMVIALVYTIMIVNKRYIRSAEEHGGFAPPEVRLVPCMLGSVALPIGLFWFAWTNSPSIHYIVSIIASVPFGFGMVLVFLSIMNYLIDAYTIYAASVLAANSVLRSLFGAAFPLFTGDMYSALGIHWASSIPAFLALACVPFPFLFYRYGANIRRKCAYAAESEAFMARIREAADKEAGENDEDGHDAVEEKERENTASPGPEYERPRQLSTVSSTSSHPDTHIDDGDHISRSRSREDTEGGLSRIATESQSRERSRPRTATGRSMKSQKSRGSLKLKKTPSGYQGNPFESNTAYASFEGERRE